MPQLPTDTAMHIKEQKDLLRSRFRAIRRSLPAEERSALDGALCRGILRLPQFQDALVILGFFPVRDEPDLRPLYEEALALGKTVAFPICHKENHTMRFRAVRDLSELTVGSYGIPEPSEDCEDVSHSNSALCVVPALSATRDGTRLGYGGGYYDRFLASFCGYTVCPLYSMLLTDSLPVDGFDVAVDQIITELGGITPNGKKSKL